VLNKRWPPRGLQRQWADEHEMIEMRYAFWVWAHESAGSRWAVAISLFSDEHSLRRLFVSH
jgi:hypothetical protein